MAGKPGKYSKKEEPASKASLTVEAMTTLLEQHKESLSAEFKSALGVMDSKLDQIRSLAEDHGQRISSLELFSDDASQRLQELEAMCANLHDANSKLATKVSDLEGCSHRSNLRILGLPESIESGRPIQFFAEFLVEVFGKELLPTPPEIDRAHRSLTAKPKVGERPCPVLLRMHRYQIKDLLVRKACKKGKMIYQGHSIRVVEDYSPDVLCQRTEYKEVMADLYKQGLQPALLYPARLRITLPNGRKKWLDSVAAAQKYIKEYKAGKVNDVGIGQHRQDD